MHQISSNGVTWGSVVNDVAESTYALRPGMPSVSKLPNGQWILTFENCSTQSGCVATYILAASPLNFAAGVTHVLKSTDGTIPSSSPYNVWTPYGGVNGTIIANAASDTAIFINEANGDPNEWVRVDTPQARSYTRQIRVASNTQYIQLMSGGSIGATSNEVTTAILDLSLYVK